MKHHIERIDGQDWCLRCCERAPVGPCAPLNPKPKSMRGRVQRTVSLDELNGRRDCAVRREEFDQ